MNSDFDWNETVISQLRVLWAEGLSAAEIGRRIGVSKNALAGKAHRLGLPARPSPIRRGEGTVERAPRIARMPIVPQPLAPEREARPVVVVKAGLGRLKKCAFPMGDPRTPAFRYCDAPALVSGPYCSMHHSICYVSIRDRREDAA